jgi:putative hemolysin
VAVSLGQALSEKPALKPYWGKPAVRNFREGNGNVGIIRSPLRAFALPDPQFHQRSGMADVARMCGAASGYQLYGAHEARAVRGNVRGLRVR